MLTSSKRIGLAFGLGGTALGIVGLLAASAAAAPIPELDPCLINPALCPVFPPPPPPPPPPAKADLKIMDLGVELSGGDCKLVVTVENLGNAAAGAFDLDVFFGRGIPPEMGELSPFYTTHGAGLAAGASTDIAFSIPGSVAGSVTNVSALVDSTRVVDESNEGNNLWFRCQTEWLGCLI